MSIKYLQRFKAGLSSVASNYKMKLALGFFVLPCIAMAQAPVALDDPNIGMSTLLSSDLEWQVDVSSEGGQSTVIAIHQSESELILVQVLTMLQVNPAAQSDAERVEFTTKEFLEGLCGPFQCAGQDGREYVALGDRHAWVLKTDLGLSDFTSLGLTESVLAATTTPQGYMQLFSLHTVPGESDKLKDALLDAVGSASFQ